MDNLIHYPYIPNGDEFFAPKRAGRDIRAGYWQLKGTLRFAVKDQAGWFVTSPWREQTTRHKSPESAFVAFRMNPRLK